MIYADYDFYTQDYLGTIADETTFKRLALSASAFLDAITFGNIDKTQDIRGEVKFAMCAVVDVKQDYATGKRGVQSESAGKVSVTYAGAADRTEETDCYKAAYEFLANTGLLFRGIDHAYQC